MNHLTPDELIDAVEETLAPARRAHLTECTRCSVEVTQLCAVLQESRATSAPEPSLLFWDLFSQRVRTAIAAEPVSPRFAHWFQWPVLVPFAGLALLVFALASALPQDTFIRESQQIADSGTNAGSDLAAADIDDSWDVVSQLVGDLDLETARQAGIAIAPGSAEKMALQLTSAEQQELVRLLRAELRAGG